MAGKNRIGASGREKPLYAKRYLVFSTVFLLLGVVLLLWTTGFLPDFSALWPVVFICVGLVFLYRGFHRNARETTVFAGMFMSLGGLVALLLNTVLTRVGLIRVWPVFMTVAGISLVAYALLKRGAYRVTLLVPAVSIVVLSFVFLPFSLKLVDVEFIQFVVRWWPSLFILLGLVLLTVYFTRKSTPTGETGASPIDESPEKPDA
ncbi:MAG: hypothetical protein EA426_04725 [Spirochaetaceae bacterium]|nr:MAG: hypothetical protein EA426_04725 [Spirochaetaceae bacterium]